MGKNKLAKFAEMAHFRNVFQPSFEEMTEEGFPLKGMWKDRFFLNDHPIVAEFGCGKGEYAVTLAERFPMKNFIGVDIKGARMYTGARQALVNNLHNVAFVRTKIENCVHLFSPGEISEIWLTFPDPQMKNSRKRLTSTRFLDIYSSFLQPGGIIHLKTDSAFLFAYTSRLVQLNHFSVLAQTSDLYASEIPDETLSIRTFYEKQWLERGIPIKYLAFAPGCWVPLIEPGEEFEKDPYRSFGRSARN
ncbi:MAG: tRNA (guanosine(46)-N7)-methyltransferase TrmB [Prolixibacteraceae bacterium]|nr:tRNA (guanosine(46)-N7)-methyltransferase TrmB [Prolixibacteraceae bacterium]MDI9564820.1 tRNA (guanosine(46)-N7)-methyltransferase TrmB [Bacteroidota bacterium]NLS99402.1 tRNA (guanosine(46)-N7)-methyltransferase TrmB [Bacteroidales bacterium]OQB80107.1 MAG: tRNA (guanine-N(7)-)-methyltransferase [Bacteroidetes bacterium ADurb.Bin123]HNU77822.1 tRNA (guanosine(46)-N7)-methyltransferase TrmB [Prolixibacteraceae bacterium]